MKINNINSQNQREENTREHANTYEQSRNTFTHTNKQKMHIYFIIFYAKT